MRPLPWVSLGLVVLLLTASVHGYDALADPAGWLLVGYGVSRLDLDGSDRRRLLALIWLAGVVAAVLWPAPIADRLQHADPSLAWAATLPRIAVAVVLCTDLATLARRADDTGAGRWLDVTRTLSLVAAAVPVLVIGGHVTALKAPADVVSVAAPVLLLVLALRYAGRSWAAGAVAPEADPLADPRESPEPLRPG